MTGDNVVDMTRMRYGFVTATRLMPMRAIVRRTGMTRRTVRRMCVRRGEFVFVYVTIMRMVQVAVVQIIRVALVLDARVSARGAMRVLVFLVGGMCHGPSVA